MRDAIMPNLDGIKWTLKNGEEFLAEFNFLGISYKKITRSVYLRHCKRTIDFNLNQFDIFFFNINPK